MPATRPPGESAAGKVVAGEEQVQRHDDDRVEEDPHDHLEDDRAVLGPHPLTADEPRRAPAARAPRRAGLTPSSVSTSGRRVRAADGRQRRGRARQRVGAVGDEHEGGHARRREDQHRQLAHRVPAAQVDERDVDDVLAVAELVREVGEPTPRSAWSMRAAVATIATRAIVTPTAAAEHGARDRPDRGVVLADPRRDAAQHERERDERHRLDEDLREREVGRAARREQQHHARGR